MKIQNVSVILALGAASLAGCSAKVSTSGQTPNGDLPGFTPPSISQPVQQAAPTALEGRWVLGCSQAPGMNAFIEGEVDFNGSTYSSILSMFRDSKCSVELDSPETQFGSFTLPAAGQINFTQANGEQDFDVYEIDQKTLYLGLQASFDAASRPQAVDHTLGYVYAGAAVIVNN